MLVADVERELGRAANTGRRLEPQAQRQTASAEGERAEVGPPDVSDRGAWRGMDPVVHVARRSADGERRVAPKRAHRPSIGGLARPLAPLEGGHFGGEAA